VKFNWVKGHAKDEHNKAAGPLGAGFGENSDSGASSRVNVRRKTSAEIAKRGRRRAPLAKDCRSYRRHPIQWPEGASLQIQILKFYVPIQVIILTVSTSRRRARQHLCALATRYFVLMRRDMAKVQLIVRSSEKIGGGGLVVLWSR